MPVEAEIMMSASESKGEAMGERWTLILESQVVVLWAEKSRSIIVV